METLQTLDKAPRPTDILSANPDLAARFSALKSFSRKIRVSEYHLTNACNIRCKGCWFFEHDFDKQSEDVKDLGLLREFIAKECARGITSALIIGGEPTLFPERIRAYCDAMKYVSISTNGLKPFGREGYEDINVFISLFGGGKLDDELRAIKPSGKTFTGLFDTALKNYRHDDRAIFVYAITESGIEHIEETVRRIADNGNQLTFNFYSQYHTKSPLFLENARRLYEEALRVKALYPEAVLSTPYYIKTMITGKSHWGRFGYETCPSISVDHPAHKDRLANGNRALPLFNTYAPDLETVTFCCTSGHCGDCRDSQAVFSWLLVSAQEFMDSDEHLRDWLELSESYWRQFVWSPFHRRNAAAKAVRPREVV